MATPGPDRLAGIYAGGQTGSPLTPDDWEARARECLPDGPFGYVAGGAGAEHTMRANREAFYRWRLRPRMLRDVASRNLSITILGSESAAPLLLAPVGVLGIVRPDGDSAAARAAAACGVPFILSTVSSQSIEDVAAVMGEGTRWFQLYPCGDREVNASLVHRAETAGYSAVVITVDTTILGWRDRDLRAAYLPFLQGQGLANYTSDPVFMSRFPGPQPSPTEMVLRWLATFPNPGLTWAEIDFVRDLTRLPVLLKGITHPDDAKIALEHGADGIIVSNHGGRQVDGAVASLDALPQVCEAVAARVPVLMDSGIRRGADVMKALALGASAVLLGRPYVYALAAGGESGVTDALRNLIAELDIQLALCGCASPQVVDRSQIDRF
jgi:lactate 2-monooxygenase